MKENYIFIREFSRIDANLPGDHSCQFADKIK